MKKTRSVGQFFSGKYFDNPIAVISNENPGFHVEKESINGLKSYNKAQSVRWITNFKPEQSGRYTFKSKDSVHIFLEEQPANNKEIDLENTKTYKLVIACYGDTDLDSEELYELDIELLLNGAKVELNADCFSVPEHISFLELPPAADDDEVLLDSDDDGIYDDWEINGYTVIGGVVKK